MRFYADKDITLDKSVPIIIRSSENDEYIIQFAVNRDEIKDLQKELKGALKILENDRMIMRGKSRGVRRR